MKSCPADPFHSLNDALFFLFGKEIRVLQLSPVSGGDINQAWKLTLNRGGFLFMKKNCLENIDLLKSEITGLKALARTGSITVPQALAYGFDGKESFLLLPFIQSSQENKTFWAQFGHNLAVLHRTDRKVKFGFDSNNYIGSAKQINNWEDQWVDFFRIHRLEHQITKGKVYFDRALSRGLLSVLDRLDSYLPEPDYSSLLHGDLWTGNVLWGSHGNPCIIDPAVYYGHPEADLAMTELFGSFPERFYHSYFEMNPQPPGYSDRKDLYNLYHLINHLNMFGPSYLGSIKCIVNRFAC